MIEYTVQPWPSTYEMIGETKPRRLVSRFGREIGAFRCSIPQLTIEPPQIHLKAPRDGHPFEELITNFERPFQVALLNGKTRKISLKEYLPGEDIVIPEYVVHWLINPNNQKLEFTCEYAPCPWDGVNDEPEFDSLDTLYKFLEDKGLREQLR